MKMVFDNKWRNVVNGSCRREKENDAAGMIINANLRNMARIRSRKLKEISKKKSGNSEKII